MSAAGQCRGARLAWDPDAEAKAVPIPKRSDHGSKAGDRFALHRRFVAHGMRLVKPTAALAWTVLWDSADRHGIVGNVSQTTIADRIGCSLPTAERAVRELKAAGLVEVKRTGGINRGSSTYRLKPAP